MIESMARDNRIERTQRDQKPTQTERQLTTSERVQLLVSEVLSSVGEQLEQKRGPERKSRKHY